MVRLSAIAANVALIATALFLWVVREGLPGSWEDWFIFAMMLVAPALSLGALFYSINHLNDDAGLRNKDVPFESIEDPTSEISDDD